MKMQLIFYLFLLSGFEISFKHGDPKSFSFFVCQSAWFFLFVLTVNFLVPGLLSSACSTVSKLCGCYKSSQMGLRVHTGDEQRQREVHLSRILSFLPALRKFQCLSENALQEKTNWTPQGGVAGFQGPGMAQKEGPLQETPSSLQLCQKVLLEA